MNNSLLEAPQLCLQITAAFWQQILLVHSLYTYGDIMYDVDARNEQGLYIIPELVTA